jgi:hypothetical protein
MFQELADSVLSPFVSEHCLPALWVVPQAELVLPGCPLDIDTRQVSMARSGIRTLTLKTLPESGE